MAARVLIADDEPNIVTSLEFLMHKCGYEVRVAGSGEEALALVESFRPDLVILDAMMPMTSGFEVCRRIRSNPALQAVKVMMLSAKGRDADVGEGLASGACAYVTKPFSTKELMATVAELLGQGT